MKSKLMSLISIGSVLGSTVAVVSCGGDENSSTWQEVYEPPTFAGEQLEDKSLVAVVSDPENPRWQEAKEEIQTAGDEVFGQTTTNILKYSDEQNEWLKTNKDEGDAFIIGATDDSLATSIKDVGNKPVVAYDRLIQADSDNYNWYVTFDNEKVGWYQGVSILGYIYDKDFTNMSDEEIVDYIKKNQLDDENGIISVAGDPADNNAHLFFDGAKGIIEQAMVVDTNLKWYGSDEFEDNAQDGWDYSKGQEYISTTINALSDDEKNNIVAVLSPNDGMASSAIVALNSAGLDPEEIYITGQDSNDQALDYITDNEKQNMTIYKPDSQAARIAVAVAANLVDGDSTNDNEEGMTAYLEEAYPGISFEIQYGKSDYYIDSNKNEIHDEGEKYINTVLLDPQIITADNIYVFFEKIE